MLIETIVTFFSDYFQSQINHMITSLTDIRSPFYTYTWLFLWILIKIYRTFFLYIF